MKTAFNIARISILFSLMVLLAMSSSLAGELEKTGWLGISMQRLTADLREAMNIQSGMGVLVKDVVEDSPAEKAGIEVGDVILQYNQETVSSSRRLTKLVRKTAPGEKVKVEISRDGKTKILTAEIGEHQGIDKTCKIMIQGDEEDADVFLDCYGDLGLLGLPYLYGSWLGPDLWLGVHTVDLTDQLAKHFGVKEGRGVLISEVLEKTPAEKAQLQAGDVIVQADGERIDDTPDLREAIDEHEEGEEIALVIIRDGKEKKLKATLAERPPHEGKKLFKKLEKFPQKLKRMRILAPGHDMPEIDIDVDREMDILEMDDLEERLEELEEELERVKEKLEMD